MGTGLPKPEKFEYEGDDGEVKTVSIERKWQVCPECEGAGKHAHAIDGNGITSSEWDEWEDEERDAYLGGHYDRRCEVCRGNRLIAEVTDETLACAEQEYPGITGQYHDMEQVEADLSAEQAHERRMLGDW